MSTPGRKFLNVPGPTSIPDDVLAAMHRPALDYSAPPFMDIAVSCFEDLKPLFGTTGEVFIYAGNGHAAWEAAISNVTEPGDTVLMPETGRFSRVWGKQCRALGLDVTSIPNDWARAIDPNDVEVALKDDPEHRIKAVLVVQVETATGVVSDVAAVRRAIDAAGHPALLIVDAIASLMTMPLPMDEWGVDVVVAASQKGLMLPPGLGFTAVNARALAAAKDVRRPKDYWCWHSRLATEQYRRFCGTAPMHLIFGLRRAIDRLNEEGLEAVFTRHARLGEATRRAVMAWAADGDGIGFQAVNAHERSNSVTAVRVPSGVDSNDIRRVARERFDVFLGAGLEDLDGRVFRIGHMGDLNAPMLLGAIAGAEATLAYLGVPHAPGGVTAALDYIVETAPRD